MNYEEIRLEVAETIANDLGHGICEDDVTITRDTVQGFITEHGTPETEESNGRMTYTWENLQSRPGEPRFDLIVVEYGDVRAFFEA